MLLGLGFTHRAISERGLRWVPYYVWHQFGGGNPGFRQNIINVQLSLFEYIVVSVLCVGRELTGREGNERTSEAQFLGA